MQIIRHFFCIFLHFSCIYLHTTSSTQPPYTHIQSIINDPRQIPPMPCGVSAPAAGDPPPPAECSLARRIAPCLRAVSQAKTARGGFFRLCVSLRARPAPRLALPMGGYKRGALARALRPVGNIVARPRKMRVLVAPHRPPQTAQKGDRRGCPRRSPLRDLPRTRLGG